IGSDANKYTLSQPTTTASVTAATLTVTGLSVSNKVYDNTTAATLDGTASLVGVLGSDGVSLSGAAVGSFINKTVGASKTVNVTGLGITGTDSGNYTLTQPTLAANITAATLTVSGITADNKVYDATTGATLSGTAAVVGVFGTDSVSLSGAAVGSFINETVGASKTVNVTGLGI